MFRPSSRRPRHARLLSGAPVSLAALLALAACTHSPGVEAAPVAEVVSLAITSTSVVDVEAGRVLPDRTVLVAGDRIRTVGESGRVRIPAGVPVVDGRGRYLVPGLWDAHVHFRGGEELAAANRDLLALYVANGVTTVRDAGGDLTERILEWRREIGAHRLVGPRILTPGPKLDGPAGGWGGSIRLSSPDDVPAALDSLAALGADYVKIYDGSISREVFLAILEEAGRRDLIVTGHMPFSVRFAEAVAGGLDATEHLYYPFKGAAANEDSVTAAILARRGTDRPLGFWAALDLLAPRYDEVLAGRLFARMAEAGTAAVPTLHIGRVLAGVAEADHSRDPELRYVAPALRATYAGRVEAARRSSPEARRARAALQRTFVGMVPRMREAGVVILAGSDAGASNSYVYPGFSLHAELEELVAAGLSPLDALRAATVRPAAFMRRGHELGQVREGYRADLILLDADPLREIAATRGIHAVVLDGRLLGRAALDSLLSDAERGAAGGR